jgi:type 1 fimbriae regulatory protein FimB/type 1 fimbriae regulatory protein FimE
MLALHLLQARLVYVNTLMLQQVLAEPAWLTRMAPEDLRALTPLVYHHVNPYGTFELDLDTRLVIEPPPDFLAAYLDRESLFSAQYVSQPAISTRVPGGGDVMPQALFSAQLPPRKPKNTERHAREYLTPVEVERLIGAARMVGRYGDRDAALILLMYRHGLRVAEVTGLRWVHIDWHTALLSVRRCKHGVSSVHPLHGPELRALRRLSATHPGMPYVFLSERGTPLTGWAIHHIISRAGAAAALPFPIHPHMLRHACGFYLANKNTETHTIQQYLGHRNIQHTVRYTELAPQRFQDFWDD